MKLRDDDQARREHQEHIMLIKFTLVILVLAAIFLSLAVLVL